MLEGYIHDLNGLLLRNNGSLIAGVQCDCQCGYSVIVFPWFQKDCCNVKTPLDISRLIGYAQKGQRILGETLDKQRSFLKQYDSVDGKIKALGKRRKELLAQHDATPVHNIVKRNKLMQQITTVVEDREELLTDKNVMLQELHENGFADVKTLRRNVAEMQATVTRLAESELQFTSTCDEAASQASSMAEQSAGLDAAMLVDHRGFGGHTSVDTIHLLSLLHSANQKEERHCCPSSCAGWRINSSAACAQ